MPVVALVGFAAAHAVLFRLYLPHRYTYPLVAFFAIAVAVSLRPTWTALWSRPRPRLRAFLMLAAPLAVFGVAIYVFPLGPTEQLGDPWTAVAVAAGALVLAGAVALVLRRAPERSVPAIGAIVTALALGGGDARRPPTSGRAATLCANTGASRVLREPAEGRRDRGRPDRPASASRRLRAARSSSRRSWLPPMRRTTSCARASGCSRRCAPTTAPRRPRSRARRALRRDPPVGPARRASGRSWSSRTAAAGAAASPYGTFISQLLAVRRAGGAEPAGRLPPLAQPVVRGVRHPLHRRPRAELTCAGTSARGALPRADGVSAKPFAAR